MYRVLDLQTHMIYFYSPKTKMRRNYLCNTTPWKLNNSWQPSKRGSTLNLTIYHFPCPSLICNVIRPTAKKSDDWPTWSFIQRYICTKANLHVRLSLFHSRYKMAAFKLCTFYPWNGLSDQNFNSELYFCCFRFKCFFVSAVNREVGRGREDLPISWQLCANSQKKSLPQETPKEKSRLFNRKNFNLWR